MDTGRLIQNACFLFFLITLCGSQTSPTRPGGSLVASINSDGLLGTIEFIAETSGTGVAIRTNLRGPRYGEEFKWRIHEFPAEYGTTNPCQEEKVGRIFVDFTSALGRLISGKDTILNAPNLKMSGPNSIAGRTIVLRSTESDRLACAVIQPTSRVRTYRARFYTPVVGEVVLRQSQFGTTVSGTLYYGNGTRRDSHHRWAILQTSEPETLDAIYQNELARCTGLQANPFIPLFDMSGYVFIGRAPNTFTGRSFYVISSAPPLETVQGGLYVVVYSDHNQDELLACGRVYAVEPKQATARFPNGTGEISFRQESPYDATLVTIDLKSLPQNAYSFGIDEMPMIDRGDPSAVCPNVRGIIFNPLKILPETVPEDHKGSMDQYAVGDLSGKYGSFQSRNSWFMQTYDSLLSLFGVNSIVGRALVIYHTNGKLQTCANVELTGRRMTTAFSTLDRPLQGQIILRQEQDSFNSDTSIYIELSYPTGAREKKTYNHPWAIYANPVLTGQGYSTGDCFQAGPRYNPYNVSLNSAYECHCGPQSSLRCQMGDTSAKLGTLNIPPFSVDSGEPQIARYYLTDPHLPLAGPTSVVGRSFVVHDQDFSDVRLACSNIIQHLANY